MRSVLESATAGPLPADDLELCRDVKAESKARLAPCERVVAAGLAIGRDLVIANGVRGQSYLDERAYDNAGPLVGRGWAYVQKGDDEQAMADFNMALKIRPNAPLALNNRGTIFLRQALQSALDDFNAALSSKPDLYFAHLNRGHVLMIMKDYDGALAEFAEADRIKPSDSRLAICAA